MYIYIYLLYIYCHFHAVQRNDNTLSQVFQDLNVKSCCLANWCDSRIWIADLRSHFGSSFGSALVSFVLLRCFIQWLAWCPWETRHWMRVRSKWMSDFWTLAWHWPLARIAFQPTLWGIQCALWRSLQSGTGADLRPDWIHFYWYAATEKSLWLVVQLRFLLISRLCPTDHSHPKISFPRFIIMWSP